MAYKQILSIQDIEGLSKFVFMIAFPILLFYSFANMVLPAHINWRFLLSYYLIALVTYSLGILIHKYKFSGTVKDNVIFGLGSSFSNLVLVGLPIISSGLGEQAILPLFMIVSIQSAIFFSLSTMLIERGNLNGNISGRKIVSQALRDLTHNPIILSLFLGLIFNIAQIQIPIPVNDSLKIFSKAALPCALFMLGASLNEYKIAGHLAESVTIVGLKMVLQPLLVWMMAFIVFDLDPIWGSVAVLAAGMPIGVNTYLFAQTYQASTKTLSAAILLSSVFAVFSQTVLLTIFMR